MKEQKVFTFYRLEFKTDKCKNQPKISVSGKNSVKFTNYPLYISDFQHHQYFVPKKLSKNPKARYSQIKVSVPYWVKELIEAVAIKQISANKQDEAEFDYSEYIKANGIDEKSLMALKKSRPIRVDETCQGLALQLGKEWGDLIRYTCVSSKVLGANSESIKKLIENEEEVKIVDYKTDISSPQFSMTLAKCLAGPNFATGDKECCSVAFEILDRYGIAYDREAILENVEQILNDMSNFDYKD